MPLQVYPRDEGERFMQKGQNAYGKKYLIAIDYFLKAGASDLPNATSEMHITDRRLLSPIAR
jgi:hypothetical protein